MQQCITSSGFPNTGQKQALDELVNFVRGTSKWTMMLLKGAAGVGKTTTAAELIRILEVEFPYMSKVIGAPTHKAVRVLKRMAGDMDAATIHSLLGMTESIDDRTGAVRFVQSRDPDQISINQYSLAIFDEASMIDSKLFHLLEKYSHRVKIIFIGDHVQTPPVSELDAMPFTHAEQYNIGVLELHEVVRQALDNPIIAYALSIRDMYKTDKPLPIPELAINPSGGIKVIGSTQSVDVIKAVLTQYFCSINFLYDSDYMKVIAWTNATVNGYNTEIRKLIYEKDTLPMIMLGEKLIMDKPYMQGKKKIFSTNDEIEVESYVVQTTEIEYVEIRYYQTNVSIEESGKKKVKQINIVHEDSVVAFNKLIESLKQRALSASSHARGLAWKKYYDTRRLFAEVKYNYAVTVHKAQGSTYTNCMVIFPDIVKNRKSEERNRIMYTAVTRAAKMLYFVM